MNLVTRASHFTVTLNPWRWPLTSCTENWQTVPVTPALGIVHKNYTDNVPLCTMLIILSSTNKLLGLLLS